jgi:hypothetical protein
MQELPWAFVISLKMTAYWDTEPGNLVEVYDVSEIFTDSIQYHTRLSASWTLP